jgi:hypothetical protein
MAANRVFFPQEGVDRWLAEGRVTIEGETLSVAPAGPDFLLRGAVCFKAEVAGGGDVHALVGKVKSIDEVTALAGEHVSGSVVLADDAYEVVDGFLGELLDAARAQAALAALRKLGELSVEG